MCSSNCVTCRRKLCHGSASASKLWKSRSEQMATGFNGGGGGEEANCSPLPGRSKAAVFRQE